MARIPKEIEQFMEAYGVLSSEIWLVAGGKNYAVKHDALERVASENGITFDPPTVTQNEKDAVAIWVRVRKGDWSDWTFGEASDANSKNKYFWAMAEKRARDRGTLKALKVYDLIKSEEEVEDWKQPQQRQNPHVNREEDFHNAKPKIDPKTGEYLDLPSIPGVAPRPKAGSRELFDALCKELMEIESLVVLQTWINSVRKEAATLPADWRGMLNGEVEDKRQELKSLAEAAE